MGGFGVVVGFMFSFLTILVIFFGAFYSYNHNLVQQADILDTSKTLSDTLLNVNYDLINPYYSSGRFNFYLKNSNNAKLFFIDEQNQICFNFFDNNKYIKKDNFNINIFKNLNDNYKFIDINSKGILSYQNLDSLSTHTFKAISCGGVSKTILSNSENLDWWNSSWAKRKIINISNVATEGIRDYQIELDFNSSNIDFDYFKEKEMRFLLPIKENFILDLPFDRYTQSLKDFSKYSNSVYLGSSTALESSDPTTEKGILFSGLKFDGIDDLLKIDASEKLELEDKLSIVSFFKWSHEGNSFQNIFTNGNENNSLIIVNDGGVNDNKILFQLSIDGTKETLYSNLTLDDNDETWHLIVATYDGGEMKLYLDSIPIGNKSIIGEIDTFSSENYIGSDGTLNFFNGSLDEFKLLNLVLTKEEIENLFYNDLRFRELDYYIVDFNGVENTAKVFVKIPFVPKNDTINIHLYYDNRDINKSLSNIEKTFTYDVPLKVGYVLSDRIALTTGLNIFSLEDNNTILVGDNEFNLDEQEGTTLATTEINFNDEVKMSKLSQVEGNGDADDIITPISWAGTNFYYRGFRATTDRFCMIAPWNDSWVEIFDAGVLEWNGTINSSGYCLNQDIDINDNLKIIGTTPILVSYDPTQDAFVFYPATTEDLFGVPSQTIYVATGSTGASIKWYESDGDIVTATLATNDSTSQGANGGDGAAPAFRVTTNNPIGAIQQADGDGVESTPFVPKKEFGTKFGSFEETDYVTVASDVGDANCSVYDSTGTLIETITNGTGVNGIYQYGFGVGNDVSYALGGWKMECDKPVWPYYENHADNDDETSLFGYLQMKQYIYPEPIIKIN